MFDDIMITVLGITFIVCSLMLLVKGIFALFGIVILAGWAINLITVGLIAFFLGGLASL